VYAEEIGDELGAVWYYAELDESGEELVDLGARRESVEFAQRRVDVLNLSVQSVR
jgi:hypothetical protein